MNIYVIQEYFLRTDVFLIPELVHLDRTLERIIDSVAREIYIIKGERDHDYRGNYFRLLLSLERLKLFLSHSRNDNGVNFFFLFPLFR